jgi:hypothetical protein
MSCVLSTLSTSFIRRCPVSLQRLIAQLHQAGGDVIVQVESALPASTIQASCGDFAFLAAYNSGNVFCLRSRFRPVNSLARKILIVTSSSGQAGPFCPCF